MMMSEFTARTGFEPTCEEYQKIEKAYHRFAPRPPRPHKGVRENLQ